jgi:type VI secretion system protein VasJ
MTALGPFVTGLERYDAASWVEAARAPVPGEDGAGRPADEFEIFDDVESELMKRGTLSQSAIRWVDVADAASELLRSFSKDLRLLLALILAAPHVHGEGAAEQALMTSAQFFSCHGATAHPRDKTRARLVERCVTALGELAEKNRPRALDEAEAAACRLAVERLAESLAEVSPELGLTVSTIAGRFAPPDPAQPDAVGGGLDAFLAAPAPAAAVAPAALEIAAPRSDQLRLDPANERALKQSLSTVAEFLLELDPAHPLGYRLRRFATWWGILAPPPIKSGDRAVIVGVAEEQAERYRAALEKGAVDAALVSRLERACHLQPFWLDGQRLQAAIARSLGREEVAAAIHEETGRFLRLVPGLEKLRFSDGSPMVPPATLAWLREVGSPGAPASGGAPPPPAERETDGLLVVDRDMLTVHRRARTLAREGALDQALAALDEARAGAKSLRAQTLWEVFILEQLREFGLRAHAGRQAERLADATADARVRDWEPDLFKRLDRLRS